MANRGLWLAGYWDIAPTAPLLLGPLQERSDFSRNLIRMRFQGEMPGIVEMHFGLWIIARKGLRPGRQEKRIVLPPYGQERRTFFAEVLLEFWVQGYIAGVVQKQVELDFVVAGPG